MDAQYWINTLGLSPHPEGGFYREVYRADESVYKSALPARFDSKRDFSSAIYYLLKGTEVSCFHRIQQDEVWHFYEGSPVNIYTIGERRMTCFRLGRNPQKGQLPMLTIKRGTIFAAEVDHSRSYALVGCTVSPGFTYDDFELISRSELSQQFPEHLEIIGKFTKPV
jgi:predicted cupin superfamily sugar epimerase